MQKFKTAAPEADLGDIAKLPETLKNDAINISKNEEAMEKINKTFREEKGLKEDEEINTSEMEEYISKLAFGQAMSSVQEGAKTNIQNIVKWAQGSIDSSVKDLIDGMKEATPGVKIDANDPELKKLISTAKSKISA